MEEDKKIMYLVKSVLGNPNGEELLKLLLDTNTPTFTHDTNEQYYRIGRADMLNYIKYLLEVDPQKVEDELIQHELD